MTPEQERFWQPYLSLIGKDNFYILPGADGFPDLIQSKHYCGMDPTGLGPNGEGNRNVAIKRFHSYQNLIAKGQLTFDDLEDIFMSYVEKPYFDQELLTLLTLYCPDLTDEQYWKLLIDCWCRQELTTFGPRAENWRTLFTQREAPMHLKEGLSRTFTAYRAGEESGFSWTLDEKRALWFKQRFEQDFGPIPLLKREFSIDDAVFYTDVRGEKEVVILPST